MLKELRDFLLRGNIVELAVAFVLGAAFAAVVNSLVENILLPVVAMLVGQPSFDGLDFTINDAVFRYGAFLTDVLQFVAIGAAIFFVVVRPLQAIMERRRTGAPEETGMPDEERRHQELLAALGRVGR